MVKELSKEKVVLAKFMQEVDKLEVINQDMEKMSLLIHEVYAKVLQNYLDSAVVIQYNYLESLKERSKGVKTTTDFARIVAEDLMTMGAKEKLTRIEEIEYRIAKKVYRDVVQAKGKEFAYGKIKLNYDDQEITFKGFLE